MEGGLRRRERAGRVVALNAAALLGSLSFLGAAAQEAPRAIDFARDVKPILDAHCVACHGARKHKADYRVDTYERAIEGSPGGKSIVPGSAAASDFYRRLVTSEADERMPQKEAPLSPADVGVLRRWIDEGARAAARPRVSGHWAFVAPVEPETPAVRHRAWIRNPIDRFVLAKLEAGGVAPSPEATQGKLLRRLRLDLTGIPPTAAELDAFEKDASPGAYEREVERVLASRPFAERWAAVWRQPADGFDALTVDVIAGDLAARDTRARGTAEVWLGATLDCARCHDHPSDPFTKEEFAAFAKDGILPASLARLCGDPPKDWAGLARWIASADNPLTARVAANRIWALFFGRGIVATLEDFGEHGAPPSNRELLDWLARDLVANGWSVKHLVSRIVTSATYRQTVRAPARLDVAVLRSQALALAGIPDPSARTKPESTSACTRNRSEGPGDLDAAFLDACARGFAHRLATEDGVRAGFRLCTGRWPDPEESARLAELAHGSEDGLRRVAEELLRLEETRSRD